MQKELAQSAVGIEIKRNDAEARIAQANGEATYISETGAAKSAEVRAVGLAKAEAYRKQVDALGQGPVSVITVAEKLSESGHRFVPEVLVNGGSGGSLDGLAGVLTNYFRDMSAGTKPSEAVVVESDKPEVEVPEKPVAKKPSDAKTTEDTVDDRRARRFVFCYKFVLRLF
jgi:hypothetical protein